MKCVIVDDEPMDLMVLNELLSDDARVEIVKSFNNPIEAKKFLSTNEVDVVFLDMEMPELNGLDFISDLTGVKHVVVVSSNNVYAADAYNFDVSDYIVKPVEKDRLKKAVDKVVEISESLKSSLEDDFAFVKDGSKIIRVDFKDILFIEALADYVQINTETAKYTVLGTMKSLAASLPERDFYRVHRSFIIRKDKIKVIEDNMIPMKGKNIPISRSAKQAFFASFNFL